jgi:type IV pilus assembly protein PilW
MHLNFRPAPRAGLHACATPGRTRGLSIVELLIGIALGLFVLAGATVVVTGQLSDNRRLLLETQIQQDLRAAADMIVRDVRRGGYWGSAGATVWAAAGAASAANPYRPLWVSDGGGRSELMYSYSSATQAVPENGIEDDAERFGFALDEGTGTIQMRLGGGGWQALTDSDVVRVTRFDIQVNEQVIPVPCAKACTGGGVACWPQQTVRDVAIQIAGRAVHDANVQRSIRSDVRLRNDGLTGACPA